MSTLVMEEDTRDLKIRYVWDKIINLKYDFTGNKKKDEALLLFSKQVKVCKFCGNPPQQNVNKLLHCPRCGTGYCSKTCQKNDWKKSHKKIDCERFQRLRNMKNLLLNNENNNDDKHTEKINKMALTIDKDYKAGMERIISKLRIYMCPYTIGRQQILGEDGFLLIQVDDKIEKYIYDFNEISMNNDQLSRSIVLEYLTVAEYTSRLKDNFELGVVLDSLLNSVKECNIKKEMVALIIAKCGWVAVLKSIPLVPDYGMCLKLGEEHCKLPQLLLNIDT